MISGLDHVPSDGSGDDPSYYHYERYHGAEKRKASLTAYYALKPLIPRRVQLSARRAYASRQASRTFPRWPFEPILIEQADRRLRAALAQSGSGHTPIVGYWPKGYRAAWILTHDVEGPSGIQTIRRVRELESRYGVRSSWNFVAEDYEIPYDLFAELRADGCEIGVHGIKHDGKLFQSRACFEAALPKIGSYMDRWDACGFRSPSLHRRADWMHELGCLYDSSFPDSDPFEPQPGGCCSIRPFMFGDVVELPITLLQDHTLWEVLQRDSCELWLRKSDWLIANHGLVCINTHPDYFTTPERFAMYEAFLAHMTARRDCWRALPREAAAWWKAREGMHCVTDGDRVHISENPAGGATVWWARENDDRIEFEL